MVMVRGASGVPRGTSYALSEDVSKIEIVRASAYQPASRKND
jgi:hypothetical protein